MRAHRGRESLMTSRKPVCFLLPGHFVPPVLRIINDKAIEYSLCSLYKAVAIPNDAFLSAIYESL